MSLRDGPLGEIKPPLIWLAAAMLAAALAIAFALFISDRPNAGPYGEIRRAADTLVAPVGNVLSTPIRLAGAGVGGVQAYLFAGSQNRELRSELDAALTWRNEAIELRQENATLRGLLGVKTDPPLPMVSADTALDARGPFSNSRLADVGANQGVAEGYPVMSTHGLVGRIAGVSGQVSRVMLLTDVESRTPVMVARTNGRAILTGDGGPNPALSYLRTHDPVAEGDRVLTSGDGGVVPRGLPVGTVVKGSDGAWRVALDSDSAPIDFVRILLFKDFAQLATPAQLAPRELPTTNTEAPEAPPPLAAPTTARPSAVKAP